MKDESFDEKIQNRLITDNSKETLIRIIDQLMLENLRLRTEIDLLSDGSPSFQQHKVSNNNYLEHSSLLHRTLRYFKTFGFNNTLTKIKTTLRGKSDRKL